MGSQNIYEYIKIKTIEDEIGTHTLTERILKNKINEVIIEYNHMAKDMELYKKAYKLLGERVKVLEIAKNDEDRIK